MAKWKLYCNAKPKKKGKYLVTVRLRGKYVVECAKWDGHEFEFFDDSLVIAWQKMPKPFVPSPERAEKGLEPFYIFPNESDDEDDTNDEDEHDTIYPYYDYFDYDTYYRDRWNRMMKRKHGEWLKVGDTVPERYPVGDLVPERYHVTC